MIAVGASGHRLQLANDAGVLKTAVAAAFTAGASNSLEKMLTSIKQPCLAVRNKSQLWTLEFPFESWGFGTHWNAFLPFILYSRARVRAYGKEMESTRAIACQATIRAKVFVADF